MRRLVVFLLVGPILGVCAILLTSAILGNKPDFSDPNEWKIGLLACFLISAPSGILDKTLAYFARPALRVPLTAAGGSGVVAAMLVFAGKPLSPLAMLVVAVCMGICSWLSGMKFNQYGRAQ
jgi:hypothetical protein